MNKLNKVIRYLNKFTNDGITIKKSSNYLDLNCYIDASFACHPDYRSHSGLIIMLGNIIVEAKSIKQKINTKSSCEAELVALSDNYGSVIFIRNILIELKLTDKPAIIFQDNKAAIQLANHGRSNSSRTKHLSIRYFFIKDRLDNKEIIIEYLNTKSMLADYLTKPLTGNEFRRFKNILMNSFKVGELN
jgi:hypothetical protein